ncbi:hypothetical protein NMY22_g28 [Coprinellus aureogranulatus]|nr:hypothetical protein NMY22_g28 [Coprinellus aureogranulatus]
MLQGVGFPKKTGTKTQPVEPPEGHMNCGCSIDHALADFVWWKTISIHSTNPSVSIREEPLSSDLISCRIRSFIIEVFQKYSFLTLKDLFSDRVSQLSTQLAGIQTELTALGRKVSLSEEGDLVVSVVDA